ncbi:hypothetical protein PCANC_10987 [Puccinia coronata f. sp. avenae]|uniref:Uncharacterized protein n=1 Tax=Puccinia coronata f. sp. avenae TaxID=200324 RepID=A0A2N5UT07_9BASI|nr:hypothetical protein PCANC_10987 [Puccinia coronata f. sp. avenae]
MSIQNSQAPAAAMISGEAAIPSNAPNDHLVGSDASVENKRSDNPTRIRVSASQSKSKQKGKKSSPPEQTQQDPAMLTSHASAADLHALAILGDSSQTPITMDPTMDGTETHQSPLDPISDASVALEGALSLKRQGDQSPNPTHLVEKRAKGLLFNPSIVVWHMNLGFTHLFDCNLQELHSPISLTIFDAKWRAAALTFQAERQANSSDSSLEKTMPYNGLSYQNKWTLSAGAWEKRYKSFIQTLRDVYHHNEGNEYFVSNIGIFRDNLADLAKATVVKFEEITFKDNPYSVGGI